MDRETRIRERAYAIWEREGRPQGRDAEHWAQATAEMDAEDRVGAAATPRRGRAATGGTNDQSGRGRLKRMAEGLAEKTAAVAGSAARAAAEAATDTVRSAIREVKPGRGRRGESAVAPADTGRRAVDVSSASGMETPKRRGRPPKAANTGVTMGNGAQPRRTARSEVERSSGRRGKPA
jgi:hypothetical protein